MKKPGRGAPFFKGSTGDQAFTATLEQGSSWVESEPAPFGRWGPVQCWAPGYLGKIPHPVPHPYIVLYKVQTG